MDLRPPCQVVSGGSWQTAIYLANTTNSSVSLQSNFDSSFNWATGPSGTLQLNPRSTVMLETPNIGDLGQSWGSFLLPPGVNGYAVFRQSVVGRTDQEAAKPRPFCGICRLRRAPQDREGVPPSRQTAAQFPLSAFDSAGKLSRRFPSPTGRPVIHCWFRPWRRGRNCYSAGAGA